jgi:peptidoglycan/LPS O-acetylase OafA/YrhL
MKSRNPGLDTLRAGAIALVFTYHYMVFVSGKPTFGVLSEVGWTGVDLFFVLSGYLIGNQLMFGLSTGRRISMPHFVLRRWLRTCPAFWVVLVAYALWPTVLAGAPMPALWRFLTFTQNIGLRPGTAFSHAWSLCIEEQFYVVLPLFIVVAGALRLGIRAAWITMGVLLALGIASRAALWFWCGTEATGRIDLYYTWVYYGTLCRFDEFLPGVALALIRHSHPVLWQRLLARGAESFLLGTLLVVVMLFGVDVAYEADGYGYFFFMSVFGYSLIAVAFSILVLSALSVHSPLARIRIPGVQTLALWSYSIYLSHKAVGHVVKISGASWPDGFMLIATVFVSLALGGLMYTYVEQPFMRLRETYFPDNFRSEDAHLTAPL